MKWGLRSPRGWIAHGVTPNAEIGTLALREWQNVPRPVRALGINASGEAARVRTEAQLTRWRVPIDTRSWPCGSPPWPSRRKL